MSILYIVPTPIGNLQDITYRALSVLRQVSYIAAENMRHTRILLNYFSIQTSLLIFNQHNESEKIPVLVEKLKIGLSIALVSSAGTPLISDPGYRLVQLCHELKIKVVPLPGACAAITALCGSGLPTDRFCFEGFLPTKSHARLNRLRLLLEDSRTLIFYEVKYRIISTVKDMINIFGPERDVVLARELTKVWESIYKAPIGQLLLWMENNNICVKGEMVLIVSGNNLKKDKTSLSPKIFHIMKLLMLDLSLKKTVTLIEHIYGINKNFLYKKYLDEIK